MAANNNDPPKNAGATSSPLVHSIPSNPTAHQQPSASLFSDEFLLSDEFQTLLARYKAQKKAFKQSGFPFRKKQKVGNSSKDRNLVAGISSSTNEEKTTESNLTSKQSRYNTRSSKNKTALFPSNNVNNEAKVNACVPSNGSITAKATNNVNNEATVNAGVTSNGSITAKTTNNVINEAKVNAGVTSNGSITAKTKSDVAQNTKLPLPVLPLPRSGPSNSSNLGNIGNQSRPGGELSQKLKHIDPKLIEQIKAEILDADPNVHWDDIAGLHHAKKSVTEMVIWPYLRPELFKGCRSPGRGLLLFGPPGTGKTMIGKAIAGECKATFFYVSASSVAGKWYGESEKLVRALFEVARSRQPAVIFVDEIDSLLSKRKSSELENETTRRIKTQFLIEMEGFNAGSDQVLLIGATNRPQDLDEAARRRLTKRLYIPLPCTEGRATIVLNVLNKDGLFKLSTEDTDTICKLTEGFSGSDMNNLVKDASMGPIREALRQGAEITNLKKEDMRPVTLQDFENSLQEVRPSVSPNELGSYEEWNKQFGSLSPSTL